MLAQNKQASAERKHSREHNAEVSPCVTQARSTELIISTTATQVQPRKGHVKSGIFPARCQTVVVLTRNPGCTRNVVRP